ncbi:MAG: hypothetical protein JXL97_16455 [Bacteroidales bacterium]|nr:hypothetical protein [Bacteroidales bacterium]
MIKIKTGKLPTNFVFLGGILLIIGAWRLFLYEWYGALIVLVGLFLFLINSGVLVDSLNKKMKNYVGMLSLKFGKWTDISSLKIITVTKSVESQKINVLSISRTEKNEVYKMFFEFENSKILILRGEKDYVQNIAKKIKAEFKIND